MSMTLVNVSIYIYIYILVFSKESYNRPVSQSVRHTGSEEVTVQQSSVLGSSVVVVSIRVG